MEMRFDIRNLPAATGGTYLESLFSPPKIHFQYLIRHLHVFAFNRRLGSSKLRNVYHDLHYKRTSIFLKLPGDAWIRLLFHHSWIIDDGSIYSASDC